MASVSCGFLIKFDDGVACNFILDFNIETLYGFQISVNTTALLIMSAVILLAVVGIFLQQFSAKEAFVRVI